MFRASTLKPAGSALAMLLATTSSSRCRVICRDSPTYITLSMATSLGATVRSARCKPRARKFPYENQRLTKLMAVKGQNRPGKICRPKTWLKPLLNHSSPIDRTGVPTSSPRAREVADGTEGGELIFKKKPKGGDA